MLIIRHVGNYKNNNFAAFVEAARALSDPGRVRILKSLEGGELCVCQIIELLGLAPSTVSKHMAVLRAAGFVHSSKRGRWVYYRLVDHKDRSPAVAGGLVWMEGVSSAPEISADRKRLEQILNTDPEKLCRRMEKS